MAEAGYALVDETSLYDLGLDGFDCLKGDQLQADNRDTHYLVYHDDALHNDDVRDRRYEQCPNRKVYVHERRTRVNRGLLMNRT